MFLESFRQIIEIESLKRENEVNRARIAAENKRISDLDQLRHKAESELLRIPEEIKSLQLTKKQSDVEQLTSRLLKLKQQINEAKNQKEEQTFLSQIAHIENELVEKENDYFSSLLKSEELEKELTDKKNFLSGSLKTREDLQVIISEQCAIEQKQIDHRLKRMSALYDSLHDSLRKLYQETEKKMNNKGAVSYLSDKKCSACFVSIDSVMKQSLEEARSFENCPNCGRFLLPESCKI